MLLALGLKFRSTKGTSRERNQIKILRKYIETSIERKNMETIFRLDSGLVSFERLRFARQIR